MNTMTATITGIDIAGFLVNDPAKAVAFYRDVVGLEPTSVDDQGRGAEFILSDGSTFGVWNEPGAPAGGFVMLAVNDIDAAIAEYRAKGLSVGDADETPVCRMAFAADPEGNGIILHQRKTTHGDAKPHAPSGRGNVIGTDIAGWLVKDPQAAIAFYRDTLGMQPTEIDELARGAEFTLSDGATFGVWNPPDGATGGFAMFAVDDIQATVQRCRSKGLGVSDITETPVCYMAFARDPEDNALILHQRKAS
jgi:predicted enzyme related to lactoylglutathione lyase